MTAPYTILVTYPKPLWPVALWRWARHRPPLRGVKVWPLCPTCARPVNAWEPRIRHGDEFCVGIVSWKNPDEVTGFALQPCGCLVEHVAMMKATVA